jgi:hypothetical protein
VGAAEPIEKVRSCPLCGGTDLHRLAVPNLNSRDPALTNALAQLVGGDWFVRQQLSLCQGCGHLFQSSRPTQAGLAALYTHFAAALGKQPLSGNAPLRAILLDNKKDYVDLPARSFRFIEQHGLIDGAKSLLELRTYAGVLPALLREAGLDHVEVGALQDFDRASAGQLFAIDRVVDFRYSSSLNELQVERERYDLIVMYEGLTHARDPIESLRWLRDRLAPQGAAVLFREPNTPAYRSDFPLEIVFNNFHMHLFSRTTLSYAVHAADGLTVDIHEETHPQFDAPLYLTAILRRGDHPPVSVDARQELRFYERWQQRDGSRVRRLGHRVRRSAKRRIKTLVA